MRKNRSPEVRRPGEAPDIVISSRQRAIVYDHARLIRIVKISLPMCMEVAEECGGPLSGLTLVECSVIGNRPMAQAHRDFLGVRGPTDVLTFPYGEILVSAPVAMVRSREFGHDVTTELSLYCIHGLLHLAGHDDIDPDSARCMTKAQERILKQALALEKRSRAST